jgi:hypothetical protein
MDRPKRAGEARWLLLIHQLPPKPAYFRVKIGRHLARLGAVAVKNSVYILPANDQAREDFAWVLREIEDGGAEALICEARFVAGLSDARIEALFREARSADYVALSEDARAVHKALPRRSAVPADHRAGIEADLARLKKRLAEIAAIDFFRAAERASVEGLLGQIEARLAEGAEKKASKKRPPAGEVRGRTWVTRRNIHIDRIASAWLVRRFIDPKARFKFVNGKGYAPAPGELRFDMFEAEYTHEGDRCTFEVLLDRFGLDDPALRAIGEIVHDVDLKDDKFGRPERAGVERLVVGLAVAEGDDEARLARGSALFGDLYESFARRPPEPSSCGG